MNLLMCSEFHSINPIAGMNSAPSTTWYAYWQCLQSRPGTREQARKKESQKSIFRVFAMVPFVTMASILAQKSCPKANIKHNNQHMTFRVCEGYNRERGGDFGCTWSRIKLARHRRLRIVSKKACGTENGAKNTQQLTESRCRWREALGWMHIRRFVRLKRQRQEVFAMSWPSW